ncbi:hypothetical protein D1819_21080 [Pseudoalteromonas tunicata]|jgi:hypothetical protein|uniref:Uncharacterized protein n=1 Tax=Pseudoalteromonas tunicata D2 TaxID=87626 RepID=A4C434_9GAMM|nr:hypothetical protein D1819_21080 [Pseudoalteromonas tunicata]EAR30316.1 hypothetical protein PTD2_02066 [Pseudoalteromonas tunicata D2]
MIYFLILSLAKMKLAVVSSISFKLTDVFSIKNRFSNWHRRELWYFCRCKPACEGEQSSAAFSSV